MTGGPAAPPGGELTTLLALLAPRGEPTRVAAALPWAPAGAGAGTLARQLGRRAWATTASTVVAAAARRRPRVVRPQRGSLGDGLRDRLRRSAGSGYVAVLPATGPSLLDEVLREAGCRLLAGPAVGADGAVRAPVRRPEGRGLLRIGLAGTAADPSPSVEGLRTLAALRDPRIPPVLATGTCAGLVWLVEGLLPGSRPRALTPDLVEQVAALTAGLPPGHGPLTVAEDAAVVAAAAPGVAAEVAGVADTVAASPLAGTAQLRHGDLWSGNLLVDGGRLTGVVDWDSWAPAGLPGVDLLHLVATDRRIATRSSLGEVWLGRPWDDADVAALLARHWPAWGADPAARAVAGWAWWLGQLAGDLRRNPALAADGGWVARNVTAVARTTT